jgi:alpha-amylase/alpha-mannosidase (GH57 family)
MLRAPYKGIYTSNQQHYSGANAPLQEALDQHLSMERYICIHCHFYQPPRENPWLEFVEVQDSAYPFHDWNERITVECYAPNAASRILDGNGRISRIVNNYARISFNFGPTLLSWMQANSPEVYKRILAADKESAERFSGHGSAIAQAYNHMILPLANRRDKYTQILWGIRDFESRFGRKPEGMWLPETAVDLESLDIMAQLGIKFTVLSPYQAARTRKMGARIFRDVSGGKVDPTHPYMVRLSEGRSIAVFFYDGPISRAVAFERLLNSGEALAHRLAAGFTEDRDWPQIMHIATDGESYGHHHRHGDMALAFALEYIEEQNLARLTNYGEYLEKFPPAYEAQIIENSAWSCAHGVQRWNSHCGCNSGGGNGAWDQQWRKPLREALDWLRDWCDPLYQQQAGELLHAPWDARDDYISIVLDRSSENIERFFAEHAKRPLSDSEKVSALKLLELQRHAMLMYTSCGWFFDEISGIETVQVIEYAGRVIQLAHDLFERNTESRLEDEFLERLALAKSNIPEHQNGAEIYRKFVRPAVIGLEQVAAHYAISSVFETGVPIYCYSIDPKDYKAMLTGKSQLIVGNAEVHSRITWEHSHLTFAVLHLGDHNLIAGVKKYLSAEAYERIIREASHAFSRVDIPELVRLVDRHFPGVSYSLKSLFRDEQRRILDSILRATLVDVESNFRSIYEHHAPLIRFLNDVNVPQPKVLAVTSEFVLNSNLARCFEAEYLDLQRIHMLLEQAQTERISLNREGLAYALEKNLSYMMERFSKRPQNLGLLKKLEATLDLVARLPFSVNLWQVQNLYYDLAQNELPLAGQYGEEQGREWSTYFLSLGRKLGIKVEQFERAQEAALAV